MPAKVLHESEGLRIVLNELNQFAVATLYYYANPNKRAVEWLREDSAGMTPEQVAREYNIDYTAQLGAKVFPEIINRRSEIVIPPFAIPSGNRVWAGFDYGTRNPSSFHVYTIIDGITYSIWELYEPCKNIPEFANKIKSCPYWNQIRYIAADPNCWTPNQQQASGAPIGVAELFFQQGIRNMLRGRNDSQAEEAWIALLRQAWSGTETTFRIFETCPEQIHEFEYAIYVNQSERQLLTDVYNEKINDKDNHSLDDCKYYMLSRPAEQAQASWNYANLADSYGQGRGKSTGRPMTTGRKPIGGYI